jgi:hypothetical protein
MGYDLRFMLVWMAALAALYWMLVALRSWLTDTPGLRARWLATGCALVAVCAWSARPGYSPGQRARVESIRRQEIAPALERYWRTHGKYPATLEEAGLQTPRTPYGPLRYSGSVSERPRWYVISFGTPRVNRFRADWDSRSERWTIIKHDW